MKFGAFSLFDSYPSYSAPSSDRYSEVLKLVKLVEKLGFASFFVGEHHFHPGGSLPSPAVWLAAAARETRRIRLGTLVSVLPLHDPIDLAEQFSLVDRLSGGRLELGVGSGNTPIDFQGYGRDYATKTKAFDAALSTLMLALEGKRIPAAAAPDGHVVLNVKPKQQPHPPIWVTAVRKESIHAVGNHGWRLGLIPYVTVSDLGELRTRIDDYRSALPRDAQPRIAAVFHVYVGDTEEGLRALRRYMHLRGTTRSQQYSVKISSDPHSVLPETLIEKDLVLVGPDDKIAEGVAKIRRSGVTDLLAMLDFGGLQWAQVQRSAKRFANITGITK